VPEENFGDRSAQLQQLREFAGESGVGPVTCPDMGGMLFCDCQSPEFL